MFVNPPLKFAPWQVWQMLNPDVDAGSGAALAAMPCEVGSDQPAGWPDGPFAWQVNPLKAAEKQLTPDMPPWRSVPWHSTQSD